LQHRFTMYKLSLLDMVAECMRRLATQVWIQKRLI
jgi:hypothetical protein